MLSSANAHPAVVYSANVRLGGGGMGSSLVEPLVGLHQAGLLRQVFVSSHKASPLPPNLIRAQGVWGRVQKRLEFYDPTGWVSYLVNSLFDAWVRRSLPLTPIFESWTGFCLNSLIAAQKRGSRTVLGLGSAHPRVQRDLINAERRAWGLAAQPDTPLRQRIEAELSAAGTILVQSRFSEQSLLDEGMAAGKLVRLPLAVDPDRFQPAAGRPAAPFRVLFLGQVTLRKGVPYLLEAWKRLGWQKAELFIAGQILPDCRPVVRHYAGLPGVRWAGFVPDQLAAFQAADVFVCPSVEDGFGLVVLEAMACGLPVVVSDHTGAADLVSPGESGFVVRYNDPAAYAQALEEVRRSPGRRAAMGRAGRAAVGAHTWDHYRRQLVQLHLRWLR